jgi:hypothetical protein
MESNCIIAALISGVSYLFYPQYIVSSMAITNSIESIYRLIAKSFSEKKRELPSVMKFIDKVPLTYLMFVYCLGMCMQLRVVHPYLVNKYTYRVFTSATNGRGDAVATRLVHAMMGFK